MRKLTADWAVFTRNGKLLVGRLVSPGGHSFATIERIGYERVLRVNVQGIFPSEADAFKARDTADHEYDLIKKKLAIKASTGYKALS